jgi:hypothetical protein
MGPAAQIEQRSTPGAALVGTGSMVTTAQPSSGTKTTFTATMDRKTPERKAAPSDAADVRIPIESAVKTTVMKIRPAKSPSMPTVSAYVCLASW